MNDKNLTAYIGKRLRERRTMLGLSQEELGKGIGITSQQVQKYEKGANVINTLRLYQFAKFLKVPPSYFYQGFQDGFSEGGVSRRLLRGVSEDSVPYDSGVKETSDRETLEVIKSFKAIRDRGLRKRAADLLRAMSRAGK